MIIPDKIYKPPSLFNCLTTKNQIFNQFPKLVPAVQFEFLNHNKLVTSVQASPSN